MNLDPFLRLLSFFFVSSVNCTSASMPLALGAKVARSACLARRGPRANHSCVSGDLIRCKRRAHDWSVGLVNTGGVYLQTGRSRAPRDQLPPSSLILPGNTQMVPQFLKLVSIFINHFIVTFDLRRSFYELTRRASHRHIPPSPPPKEIRTFPVWPIARLSCLKRVDNAQYVYLGTRLPYRKGP